MGLANFYLKINLNEQSIDIINNLHEIFGNEKIFRILDKNETNCLLSIECIFDNFLPSLVITYNELIKHIENIISIETHRIETPFNFTNFEDFVGFVLASNKDQLIAYYNQMGYLGIDSENYYQRRNRLKKYYIRLC